MTSPMFTRGFSFGMVSPLEGVAYSLTAGVARENFWRMVPIRQRVRRTWERRLPMKRDEGEEKGEPKLAFLRSLSRTLIHNWGNHAYLCVGATVAGCCRRNSKSVSLGSFTCWPRVSTWTAPPD